MNERIAVKLTAGKPIAEKVYKKEGDDVLDFSYREIECDTITIVPSNILKAPYLMIADDEGLLKDKPLLNILGSYLYGIQDHGNPLVGNVLIMKENGEEILWLTEEEYGDVMSELASIFMPAIEAIYKNAR